MKLDDAAREVAKELVRHIGSVLPGDDEAALGILLSAAHGQAKKMKMTPDRLQAFTANLWESLGDTSSRGS